MHMHVCMHVPTAAQPHLKGVWVCTSCTSVCAATISLIHPRCLSVCLYMYVRLSRCFCKNVEVRCSNKHLLMIVNYVSVLHAHKSGQTKNRYVHTHKWSINTNVFAPNAAQPHLKGVRVCTTCASVCAAIISLIHPLCLSVCLYVHVLVSWCLYTQCWGAVHVQQASDDRSNTCHIHSYVHTLTHIQHFHSSTVLCKQPRETCKLT